MSFRVPNRYRLRAGRLASDDTDGNNGLFMLPSSVFSPEQTGQPLTVIASDGAGWEHVSVSRVDRCPSWGEMCAVKALFWERDDCVVQYHPSERDYVDFHPRCLHLWRPIGVDFPRPPAMLVGPA